MAWLASAAGLRYNLPLHFDCFSTWVTGEGMDMHLAPRVLAASILAMPLAAAWVLNQASSLVTTSLLVVAERNCLFPYP